MENKVTTCKIRLQREGMESTVGKVALEAWRVQRYRELGPVLQSARLCARSIRPAKTTLFIFFIFSAFWKIHTNCTCLRNASLFVGRIYK